MAFLHRSLMTKAAPYVHRKFFRAGAGFRFLNLCSTSSKILCLFSCSNRAGKKMEQDSEWILGSKSRIFGNPVPARAHAVYVRSGLRSFPVVKQNTKHKTEHFRDLYFVFCHGWPVARSGQTKHKTRFSILCFVTVWMTKFVTNFVSRNPVLSGSPKKNMTFFLANSTQERSGSPQKCFHVFFHEVVHCTSTWKMKIMFFGVPKKFEDSSGKKKGCQKIKSPV